MDKLDFVQVTLEEIISYSKKKDVPAVTIIADVITKENFKYINVIASRLKLYVVLVKNTNMVAIIDNALIARKMAKELNKRCQLMYYDFIKRPSGSITIYALTGYTHHFKILRDNGHIIKAFNEQGKEIKPWLNANVPSTESLHLNKLGLSKYKYSVCLNGKSFNSRNLAILEQSRLNFINNGIYDTCRNCYYPSGKSNKDIAETNKINKLFKKSGLKKL